MRALLLLLSASLASCAEPGRLEWGKHRAFLLFFVGHECPVSNQYAPEIERISRRAAAEHVAVYRVYPDPELSQEKADAHGREFGISAPALLDQNLSLASKCGVTRVLQTVLLSSEGEVLYRGRIDDRYSPDGKRRDDPRTHDLEDALDAVLAGQSPLVKETPVYGCPLPSPWRLR